MVRTASSYVLIALAPFLSVLAWMVQPNGYVATTTTPIALFSMVVIGALAAYMATKAFWLGAFLAWATVSTMFIKTDHSLETLFLMALGCVMLMVLRHVTEKQKRVAVWCLTLGGVAQVVLATVQWLWFDPAWGGNYGPIGLFGNRGYLGLYLAIITPIAPIWALVPLAYGLLLSNSSFAVAAAAVGLAVRYPRHAIVILTTGAGCLFAVISTRPDVLGTWTYRWEVWKLAWSALNWKTLLVGNGIGSWFAHVPWMQDKFGVFPKYYFTYAHNEYLQVLYELGWVGLGCAVMALWSDRKMFLTRFGGGVAALLVLCVGWFPLHLANVAFPGMIVYGLARTATLTEEGG